MADTAVPTEPVADAIPDGKKKQRSAAPNEAAHKAAVEALTNEIKALEDEREKVRIQPKAEGAVNPIRQKRDELFAKLKAFRESKQPLIEERKKLGDKADQLKEQLTKKGEELKAAKASGKFRKPEDVDDQIRKLQARIDARPTLKEEKQLVTEINALKRSKKNLGDMDASKMGLDQLRATLNTVRDAMTELKTKIQAIRTQEDGVKAELDNCKDPAAADMTKRRARYQEIKAQLDEKYDKRRKMNKEFSIAKREHWEATRAEREERRKKREEEKKAWEEKKRAEREAKQREYDEWEASRPPYEDEIATCKVLVGYLEGLLPKSQAAPAAAADPGQATADPDIADRFKGKTGEFMIKKKGADDDMFMKMGGGKKKGKKKGKKAANKNLKHSPQVFSQFASIDLKPPTTQSEVAASVTEVQDKIEYYEHAPPPEKKKKSKPAPKAAEPAADEPAAPAAKPAATAAPSEVPLPPEANRTWDDDASHGKTCPSIDSLVYCQGEQVEVGKGEPVLIWFWAKFAKGDYLNVCQVSDIYNDLGIKTVGISLDPEKAAVDGFIKKFGKEMAEIHVDKLRADFPLALDAGKTCKKKFMEVAELSSIGASCGFVVDGEGTIVWHEQFSQFSHTVAKGQLREQIRRLLAGEELIKNGNKPAADDEEDELSDIDMDMGSEDEDGLMF